LEHLIWPVITVVMGTLMAITGGSIGYKLVTTRGDAVDSKSFNSRLGYLQDENSELKKYLKSMKGKINQQKQGPTLDEGESIDEGGFESAIPSLISKYASMAPKKFQFLLRDPAIVSFLVSEAKKNPEQAKEVLKHFIGGNGDANKESSDTQREQLEALQDAGA